MSDVADLLDGHENDPLSGSAMRWRPPEERGVPLLLQGYRARNEAELEAAALSWARMSGFLQ